METKNKKLIDSKIFWIFIIGLVLRLILLFSQQDMWHDASFTVLFSEMPLEYIVDSNDVHPPLYYIYLKAVLLFSDDELWIRFSSIMLWGAFFYWFNKFLFRNFNGMRRYISLLFITISPTFVYYSLEPRNYILGLVFVAINLYSFFEINKGIDKRTLFVVSSILMLYTHYFTVFVLIVEAFFIIIKQKDKIKNYVVDFIFIWAVSLPVLFYIFRTLPKLEAFWFKDITLWSFFSTISFQFWFPDTVTAINIICLIMFGVLLLFINKRNMFLVALFFVPIIFTWMISQVHQIYHHRFFLFYAPAIYILIGDGMQRFYYSEKFFKNVFMILLFFLSIGVFLTSNARMIDALPDEIHDSQKFLKEHYIDENETTFIVHVSSFSSTPYNYYFRDYNVLNFLKTNLTERQLFTAGGSVIPDWSIINNTIDFKQYYLVTHNVMLDEKQIWNEGGLRIYDIQ